MSAPVPLRGRTFELGCPYLSSPVRPGVASTLSRLETRSPGVGGCDDVSQAMEPVESDGGPKGPEGRARKRNFDSALHFAARCCAKTVLKVYGIAA